MSSSASAASKVDCSTSEPPAANVAPSAMREIAGPEEAVGRPAAHVVFWVELVHPPEAPHLDGHAAMSAQDALGLAGGTRREKQHPGIAGMHRGGGRSTSSRGSPRPAPGSLPSLRSRRCRTRRPWRGGAGTDTSLSAVRRVPLCVIPGSSSVEHFGEILLEHRPLEQQHRTPEAANSCSSSAGVEKVLNVAATPPASPMPNTAATHSGRLVINTPTRPPLPRPPLRRAHATSTARSHRSS